MGRAKTLAFSAAAVVLALAVLEAGARVAMYAADIPRTRPVAVGNPYHPYLGWEHAPNLVASTPDRCSGRMSVIRTNAAGRSVTPLCAFDPPEAVVAVTGGSSMMGVGSTDNAHTTPSILERLLYERTGVRAEVVNLGTRGYQSFQEMLALRRYFLEHPADVVVSVSGRNDAYFGAIFPDARAATLPDRVFEIADVVRRMEAGRGVVRVDMLPALRARSAFVDLAARLAGVRRGPEDVFAWNIRERGVMNTENVGLRVRAMNEHFAMAACLCAANNAEFVLFLQPTAFSRDLLSAAEADCLRVDSPKNRYLGRYERAFYHAFRSAEHAFRFVDLSRCLDNPPGPVFADTAHTNDLGAALVAEAMFPVVAPMVTAAAAAKARREQADAGGRAGQPECL